MAEATKQPETKARPAKITDTVMYVLPTGKNAGQKRAAFVTNVLPDGRLNLNVQLGDPYDFAKGNVIPGYGTGTIAGVPQHIFSSWAIFGVEHDADGEKPGTWHRA